MISLSFSYPAIVSLTLFPRYLHYTKTLFTCISVVRPILLIAPNKNSAFCESWLDFFYYQNFHKIRTVSTGLQKSFHLIAIISMIKPKPIIKRLYKKYVKLNKVYNAITGHCCTHQTKKQKTQNQSICIFIKKCSGKLQ